MTNSVCMALTLKPKLNHQNLKHFTTNEEIKEKSKHELLAISKSLFQKCFEDWKKRWHKYIISEGVYFEGDKIVVDR